MTRYPKGLLLAAIGALCLLLAGMPEVAAQASGGKARADYESHLAAARAMASALQADAGRPGVKEALAKADGSIREAAEMAAVGEYDLARSILDEGYVMLTTTLSKLKSIPGHGAGAQIGMSGATASAAEGRRVQADFGRREEGAKALRVAFARLVDEKEAADRRKDAKAGPSAPQRALLAEADRLLAEAQRHAQAGQHAPALTEIDRANLLLRSGISELQHGTEVTASKAFATPADEYRYEQARNDDYAQLIAGLAQERKRSDWVEAAARARTTREQADQSARDGDFGAALKQIDESTRELKTILRRAGFPIV